MTLMHDASLLNEITTETYR